MCELILLLRHLRERVHLAGGAGGVLRDVLPRRGDLRRLRRGAGAGEPQLAPHRVADFGFDDLLLGEWWSSLMT